MKDTPRKQSNRKRGNPSVASEKSIRQIKDLDTRVALIRMLIPVGLEYVNEMLQGEITALAGARYSRNHENIGCLRWGSQGGSIYLDTQNIPIRVPRVRDIETNEEIPLEAYQKLRSRPDCDEKLLLEILYGLSCRNYERVAHTIPEAFGMSPSNISRRFVAATKKKLEEFENRRLEKYEFVAIVVDGKTLADDKMVIALGITLSGEKVLLGFVQTATENATVCREFFQKLIDRGLCYQQGLLFVIDGAKGIRKAITDVFGQYALVQRCQWHKRENVVSYLAKSKQAAMRKKLQQAYEQPDYETAKAALNNIRAELALDNESAAKSLDEGLEETLTLHRLGVFKELGISLKTTNCLESINAQVSDFTSKVTYWTNSHQKHRWVASALLEIEKRLRRIKGYNHLPALRKALQLELKIVVSVAA
jgi:putative transposase